MGKVKNIDLSEGWTANELSEDNTAPTKMPMRFHRKKHGYEYVFPEGSYTKVHQFYRYVPRFLEKNTGRPFDEVYSEYCEKVPERIGDVDTRDAFRRYFIQDHGASHYWYYYMQGYYVDKKGNIRRGYIKRNKRNKGIYELWEEEPKVYHICDKGFVSRFPRTCRLLYEVIGAERYHYLVTADKIPEAVLDKIKCEAMWKLSPKITEIANEEAGRKDYLSGEWVFHDMFPKHVEGKMVTLEKGDGRYEQYQAEQEDAKKKQQRVWKKQKEAELEEVARVNAERRKELEIANIVDRDRLGFDGRSFKKDPEKC